MWLCERRENLWTRLYIAGITNCENTNQLIMTMNEVEAEERQEDLTAREQYRAVALTSQNHMCID